MSREGDDDDVVFGAGPQSLQCLPNVVRCRFAVPEQLSAWPDVVAE
jgi:hypothetical protein